ncbi:uncharacterized protein LOC119097544, partial [Pollicipes pollicipes]|uniref:uncharacterized protein LOC119097544 n=1 Tax=Pollicipes pollicipes TaxID=41117 RepID=UPI0018850A2D
PPKRSKAEDEGSDASVGGDGSSSDDESTDEESDESDEASEDSDDSDEPIYTLRARRPAAEISQKVKQFDEMIDDAIRVSVTRVRWWHRTGECDQGQVVTPYR